MQLATLYSRAGLTLDAPKITIEAHLSNGLPSFSIVGLPETAVKESKDRVRSAILNSGFDFPTHYRIIINLAPADLPKGGGRLDLPIAIGILAASKQIPMDKLTDYEFAGELGLSGELRPTKTILPMALKAKKAGRKLIIPMTNAEEAALCKDLTLLPAAHLLDVCAHLKGEKIIEPFILNNPPVVNDTEKDLSEVKGQTHVKRALEIAAAGGHSILMSGPPGTGKTLLATRFAGLLPPLSEDEAIEVAAIHSLAGHGIENTISKIRPFRAPHHSSSAVALVGGGSNPKPGEISLAHHGVLFLDELPEFNRHVLEMLREPLESGHITISRANHKANYPAQFQLVAAMNPCPCGYHGDTEGQCRCTQEQVTRYQNKLSGPLLDRIDLYVDVPRIPKAMLAEATSHTQETSKDVQQRVVKARAQQAERAGKSNSELGIKEIERDCKLNHAEQLFFLNAMEKLGCSPRSYHRLLKVARTVADLDGSQQIELTHINEALSLRKKQTH